MFSEFVFAVLFLLESDDAPPVVAGGPLISPAPTLRNLYIMFAIPSSISDDRFERICKNVHVINSRSWYELLWSYQSA